MEDERRHRYRLLKDGELERGSDALERGTVIHEAIETLLKHGMEMVFEPDIQKVSFALRLAKLQSNYRSAVEPEVLEFLESVGIEDIYNPPNEWIFVDWKGRQYRLFDLEDERGYVTPYGLAHDWPAMVPDADD